MSGQNGTGGEVVGELALSFSLESLKFDVKRMTFCPEPSSYPFLPLAAGSELLLGILRI